MNYATNANYVLHFLMPEIQDQRVKVGKHGRHFKQSNGDILYENITYVGWGDTSVDKMLTL